MRVEIEMAEHAVEVAVELLRRLAQRHLPQRSLLAGARFFQIEPNRGAVLQRQWIGGADDHQRVHVFYQPHHRVAGFIGIFRLNEQHAAAKDRLALPQTGEQIALPRSAGNIAGAQAVGPQPEFAGGRRSCRRACCS